jgi:hypothetical protein
MSDKIFSVDPVGGYAFPQEGRRMNDLSRGTEAALEAAEVGKSRSQVGKFLSQSFDGSNVSSCPCCKR